MKGLKLTARGELVADVLALVGALAAVTAWTLIAFFTAGGAL